jgi:hypothetical protein
LIVTVAVFAGIKTVETPWGRSGLLPGKLWLKKDSPKDSQANEISPSLVVRVSVHDVLKSPELYLGKFQVAESRIDGTLNLFLQPASHLDIVRIDSRLIVRKLALQKEHMAGPTRREQDAPEAGIGGHRAIVRFTETNVGVLSG